MLNNKSSAVVEKISEHFLRPEQLDSRLVGLQAQLNTLRDNIDTFRGIYFLEKSFPTSS